MRILKISDVYFPRINGVSTSIRTFRHELQVLGHEVTLIAPAYGQGEAPEADLIRIPARPVIRDPEDRFLKWRHILNLTPELAKQGFDLIHIHTPFVAHYVGVALSKRLGLPRVESYHTFFEEYLYHYIPFLPKAWLRFAARRLTNTQCNNVDALVVPSTAMLGILRNYGVKSPAAIVPTGIELERFKGGNGARFRERYGIPGDRPTLVHIGRVAFEKNIDFLLEVTKEVKQQEPRILLIIAGEGPALNHLKKQVDALGLKDNVLFIGYLDREAELPDCYHAGDAFVFASRTETQGLVLLEAMALGIPVVSTAVMGTRDVVGPGRGALVAEDNVADFTAKVLTVLRDPELRQRLSAEGREYVKSWSAKACALRLLELYQLALRQHKAAPMQGSV